ncbi:ATP-binding protein [Pseudonocardia sp. H11422]|uniref:ATP-binding protein n=1 Tax=Pseudonocardia sp. H11422 TaxID=2835866 RepID=UPI001BDD1AA9|nr:ATP-binding protein [Pseudonocardia sp. H11422]
MSRARRSGGLGAVAYALLLAACTAVSLGWLAVGAVVAVATYVPGAAATLTDAAAQGDRWAEGVLAAMPRSEPLAQAVLDYTFSLIALVVAVLLLIAGGRSWPMRLLVIAMVGSAGAFNLQAHAAAVAVQTATGLAVGGLHQVLLHGVAGAAYILALLMFPAGWDAGRGSRFTRVVLVAAGSGTLFVVGFGTALLPHSVSCVLFFGFLVPQVGLIVLPRRIRGGATAEQRTQARLLFSVLVATSVIAAVLGLITLMLWSLGWPGLVLVDPTAHSVGEGGGEPTGLLFWFARLASVAIAGAVLVAARRTRLWAAERLFSRGLAAALVVALVGGGYVLVGVLAGFLIDTESPGGAFAVAAFTTGLAALVFSPLQVRAERVVDRLLYGTRPTPYSVLAGIAELSHSTATDEPDLARVAEAVGRGLGAGTCRLTVFRPGLRDRAYTWVRPGHGTDHDPDHVSDDLVEVPVRQGEEQVGAIAVDRGAVAGLHAQRDHLLEDVADSLGVVLQASRFGIELERQLRAALAHAGNIAASRRQAVAEMDSERRRIERDLHDGAQHHLVSLRLTLGLVEHQVSTGQFDQARDRLDQITGQIGTAEMVLAETATGVSSPLLAERGLITALDVELGGGHPPVEVDADGIGAGRRFPADVEAAVYFCCLESVNNARKHAPGAAVGVRLATADGALHFTVHDDGPGWDQGATAGSPGRGMRNLTSRITAVGGRIAVRSAPGAGTTITGTVPLPVEDARAADVHPAGACTAAEAGTAGAPHAGPAPPGAAPVRERRGNGRAARTPAVPQAPVAAGPPLLDQVREAVVAARELYHRTDRGEPLRMLAERLDEPLRIAVVGAAGAGTSTLVAALAGYASDLGAPAPPTLIDVGGLGSADRQTVERVRALLDPATGRPIADAFVLLLRHQRPDDVDVLAVLHGPDGSHRPAHALGVLARADELGGGPADALAQAQRASVELGADPQIRRLCQTVVPVAGLLALAGGTLGEVDYRSLYRLSERDEAELRRLTLSADGVAGALHEAGDAVPGRELLDRLGLFGVRLAIELIRTGRAPTSAALARALLDHSGLPRLGELLDTCFVRRAEALKARSALRALDALVRTAPPADEARPLRYLLERIRSGAHELIEIDLVDALRSGALDLPDEERRAAEELLGASGPEPWARLGLATGAAPQEVARAAAVHLARWQQRASHPGSPKDVRDAAGVLVRTCEQLLAGAGASAE